MTPAEIAAHAAALRQFATPGEIKVLDALEMSGSLSRTAATAGLSRSTIHSHLRNLAARAAKRGWAPDCDMTNIAPEPFVVRGTSTLYDADGKPKLQWVKTRLDDQRAELLLVEMAAGLAETLPRLPALPAPAPTDASLLNLYTFTDCHVGMLAWHREGGADWDIQIAERTLLGAFERMIAAAPRAQTCFIANLGDFLHWDGLVPVTPSSGHVLDADTRFAKVVRAAVRTLRRIVDMALLRHERVHLLMAEGNHDPAASVWLAAMFTALFENDPRLTVVDSPLPYYAHQHGRTLLAFHHGHLKRFADLPLLMAAQFPTQWGSTAKRYVHTGHLHHAEEKDFPGIRVVRHPTLAARDAYAARGGWISERQASVLTYHAEFGHVGTAIVTPEMLI